MNELTVKQRQYLKGLAHGLQPVVMIGNNGLTPAVIKEIQLNINAHELIKVKVLGDDREVREALILEIIGETGAQFVQHIGKQIVLFKSSEKQKITLPKE
jgi:RNA-binding protein